MTHRISNEKIKELSEKWMKGTLSEEERAIFESWYDQQTTTSIQWPGHETEEELRSRIFSRIDAELHSGEGEAGSPDAEDEAANPDAEQAGNPDRAKLRTFRIRRWVSAAAAVIVIIAGASIWYNSRSRTTQPVLAAIHPTPHQTAEKPAAFIRHFTLPDGTRVVLQIGSRLDYPKQFTGGAREVSLSGEAYFDVAEDKVRPFIIHTGRIRTTVLGTTFNIRALPNDKEVVVSVTNGKVKVEDNQKLLAVLTSNQQVKYQPTVAVVSRDSINAASLVTNWTKQEMAFDGQSFGEVAEILGRRYGVDIQFKKEGLKKCSIKAFFNGTESLENVLNILCTISNTSHSTTGGNTVVLDGEGCGG
jgi:ferric-dicitrate binding protein FerR (iron transport regulator)